MASKSKSFRLPVKVAKALAKLAEEQERTQTKVLERLILAESLKPKDEVK